MWDLSLGNFELEIRLGSFVLETLVQELGLGQPVGRSPRNKNVPGEPAGRGWGNHGGYVDLPCL